METLKVLHEENNCGGNLIHVISRPTIRNNELVRIDLYRCPKCHATVEDISLSDDVYNGQLTFMI